VHSNVVFPTEGVGSPQKSVVDYLNAHRRITLLIMRIANKQTKAKWKHCWFRL